MEYTRLGGTGLEVSELCYGTWRFGAKNDGVEETTKAEAHELLDAAADAGINFFDTANVYGDPNGTSEQYLGEWLDDRDREDFVIASKVNGRMADRPNGQGLSRKHIRWQIEESLDRLGTDYLDLYYIHRWDDSVPIRETLATLNELVKTGKVHYLGASTMAAWKLTKALWTGEREGYEPFTITQPHYSVATRHEEDEYLALCEDQDLAVCPWSPLDGGFLTGKYDRDSEPPEDSRGDIVGWWDVPDDDKRWQVLDAVTEIAEEIDATPAQVSLQWLIAREAFTCVPIIGARNTDQLEENLGAVDLTLTEDHLDRLEDAYDN